MCHVVDQSRVFLIFCLLQKSSHSLNKDVSAVELATVAPEQPSLISVQDASFYQEGMPPSPVGKTSNAYKGEEMVSLSLTLSPHSAELVIICDVL